MRSNVAVHELTRTKECLNGMYITEEIKTAQKPVQSTRTEQNPISCGVKRKLARLADAREATTKLQGEAAKYMKYFHTVTHGATGAIVIMPDAVDEQMSESRRPTQISPEEWNKLSVEERKECAASFTDGPSTGASAHSGAASSNNNNMPDDPMEVDMDQRLLNVAPEKNNDSHL